MHVLHEVAFDAKVFEAPSLSLPTHIKRRTGWLRQIRQLTDHATIHPHVHAFFLLWSNELGQGWIADLSVLQRVAAGESVPIWRKKRGEPVYRHYLPEVHLIPERNLSALRRVDYLSTLAQLAGMPSPTLDP